MNIRGLDLLLSPASVLSIAVLALNDHVLKTHTPGFITGKLSDFAGLYFFPFFVFALAALVRPTAGTTRCLGFACRATALLFVAINVSEAASDTYEQLVAGIWQLLQAPRRVHHVADMEDLIALPMVALAYVAGRSQLSRTSRTETAAVSVIGSAAGARRHLRN